MKQLTILNIVISSLNIILSIIDQKWGEILGWSVAVIWQVIYLEKILKNEQ